MESFQKKFGILNGNILKFIAALSMLIDHIGVIFFPRLQILRIIGRLALPIFAFMIAQGCKYTKNKLRYFFSVFTLAFACQTVYFLYNGDTYMNVLITFSLSIIIIYALQNFKNTLFRAESQAKKVSAALLLILSVVAVFILNIFFEIDYGFPGCMLAVFASMMQMPENAPEKLKKLDCLPIHVGLMALGLIALAIASGKSQPFSLLAIPLLLLYSGKRGKMKTKYFFYIFYPSHLAVLEAISLIFAAA